MTAHVIPSQIDMFGAATPVSPGKPPVPARKPAAREAKASRLPQREGPRDHAIRFPPAEQQELIPGAVITGPPGVELPKVRLVLLTPDIAHTAIGNHFYRDEGNGDYREGLAHVERAIAAGALQYTGEPVISDWSSPPRILSGRPRLRGVIATGMPILVAWVEGVDPKDAVVIDRHSRHRGRSFADALPAVLASPAAANTPHSEFARLWGRLALCWMELTPDRARACLDSREEAGLPCRRLPKGSCLARDVARGRFRPTGQTIKFNTDNVMIDGVLRCLAVIEANTPVWVLVAHNIDARIPEAVIDVSRPSNYGHRMQAFDTSEGWDIQSSLRRLCRQNGIPNPTQIDIQELHDALPGFDNVVRQAKRHQHIVPQCVATPVRSHIGQMRSEAVANAFLDRILPQPAACRDAARFAAFRERTARGMGERELRAAEAIWDAIEPLVGKKSKAMSTAAADRLTNTMLQVFRIHEGGAVRMRLPKGRILRLPAA